MVVVHNVAVAASRRVPERRQRLVGGGEGAHGDWRSKCSDLGLVVVPWRVGASIEWNWTIASGSSKKSYARMHDDHTARYKYK
jgi:hypothetical protein